MDAPGGLLLPLPHVPATVIPQLEDLEQFGIFGIGYDIYTNPIKAPPPLGWGAYTGSFYGDRIIPHLTQHAFIHDQYSDRLNPGTTPHHAYLTMVQLRAVRPLSKIATTLKAVKMYYLPDHNVMDQTVELQLGGYFARGLEGPAPAQLVASLTQEYNMTHPVHLHIGPFNGVQPNQFIRPVNTRNTPAANNPNNWVM